MTQASAQPPAEGTSATQEEQEVLRRRIAALEDELLGAQRRAALGTLAAVIAHEFNNLMTPVLPWVELALETGRVEDMRKALERTQAQARRATAVTQRLLDVARGRELPVEACSVRAAVEQAVAAATRPFEKDGIELSVSAPPELRVRAQPDLLVQALLNLLLNAREAMKGARGPLSIVAQSDGEFVRIAVRDSGRGLSREQVDEVLNPFLAAEDVDRPPPGVGLGLSACRLIARKHGATLRARCNEGRGCTFELRWPAG